MRNFTLPILTIFFLLSVCSCKKDSKNPKPSSIEIKLEKETYFQFEIAQAALINIELDFEKINATFSNGILVELTRVDNFIVFIVPKDCIGPVDLSFTIHNENFKLSFEVVKAVEIVNPDLFINDKINNLRGSISEIELNQSVFQGQQLTSFKSDISSIKDWVSDLEKKYSALTLDEKLINAQIFKSNENWLTEISEALDSLKISGKLFKKSSVENWEMKTDKYMQNFTKAVVKLVGHVPKMVILIASGSLFGPVGAAIGAGLAIGNFLSDLKQMYIEEEKLINHVVLPFESPNIQQKKSMEFDNNSSKELVVRMNYRSIYKADLTSGVSFIKSFIGSVNTLTSFWNDFKSKLNFLKLNYTPRSINSIDTYKSELKQVHSDFLDIKMITNPKVVVTIDRTDGSFTTKFNSTSYLDESFQFQLVYANKDVTLTSQYDAVVHENKIIYRSIEKSLTSYYNGTKFNANYDTFNFIYKPEIGEPSLNFKLTFYSYSAVDSLYFSQYEMSYRRGLTQLYIFSPTGDIFPTGKKKQTYSTNCLGPLGYSDVEWETITYASDGKEINSSNVDNSEHFFSEFDIRNKLHSYSVLYAGWLPCSPLYDFGLPLNTANIYIPIRISQNSNYYYGWIRISTLGYNSFIIHDLAINGSPNRPILTGQK